VRELTVAMGEYLCEPITFRNPLSKALPFLISLENQEGNGAFSVILKSSKVDLAYGQELEIPVTIKPTSVTLNTTILKIMVNEKICWKYELRAKTVFRSEEESRVFKIPSRSKVEQAVEFVLPFSERYNGDSVTLNIVGQGDVSGHFLRSAVKLVGSSEVMVLSEKIGFSLSILSFKPKNVLTVFEVCARNGCKWLYRVRFNFLPPPVDDQLDIATPINKPASVKFKLTNRLKAFAKFHAYFTSDSCIEFTVSPKHGELEPYGREGTPIEVVFCPTQYKKSWTGRLVIETEESYWSYDVRGTLPLYSPPVGVSTLRQ
jgi:hypothetical protein